MAKRSTRSIASRRRAVMPLDCVVKPESPQGEGHALDLEAMGAIGRTEIVLEVAVEGYVVDPVRQ